MVKNLDKFFDPATLPKASTVEVDILYFKAVRRKLQAPFAIPNNPTKIYSWDYPLAEKLINDSIQSGIEFVLIEKEIYEQKVRLLAKL